MDLAGAEVAVVAEAGALHGLAVDDDVGFQCLDQPGRGGLAETAIALRKPCRRHRLCLLGRQGMLFAEPEAKGLVVFLVEQAGDDLPLLLRREVRPSGAEACLGPEFGRNFVSLDLRAVLALLVEPGLGGELQNFA